MRALGRGNGVLQGEIRAPSFRHQEGQKTSGKEKREGENAGKDRLMAAQSDYGYIPG